MNSLSTGFPVLAFDSPSPEWGWIVAMILGACLLLQAGAALLLGRQPRVFVIAEAGLLGVALAGLATAALFTEGAQVALRLGLGGSADPHALGVGLLLHQWSGLVAAMVAFLGWVIVRFSRTYLRTEAAGAGFVQKLLLATLIVQLFVLSSNLLGHAVLWLLISVSVHWLLRHYDERPRARLAARKKFLLSRLGDAAFAGALLLLFGEFGTLDVTSLLAKIQESGRTTIAAHLIVVAVLAKSAQVPFHSWLPETMDAPTPVSAFMHAGVVNAGAFLLITLAPLLAVAPSALNVLILVGSITAALGTVVGSVQPSLKLRLAYSTVAQMGFLLFEIGLGMLGAAALHLVAHAIYKAYLFLRSGTAPLEASKRQDTWAALTGALAASLSIAGVGLWGAHALWGETVIGYAPLATAWAIGLSQLFLGPKKLALPHRALGYLCVGGGLWSATMLVEISLAQMFPALPHAWLSSPGGAIAVALALTLLLVAYFVGSAPKTARSQFRGWNVHALSGFYFSEMTDRLTRAVWPDGHPPHNTHFITSPTERVL